MLCHGPPCMCCVLTCSVHSTDSDYGDQECGWYVAHIQASDHVSLKTLASFSHALAQVSFLLCLGKWKVTCLKHKTHKHPHRFHQPHSFKSVTSCSRLDTSKWQGKWDRYSTTKVYKINPVVWRKHVLSENGWDHAFQQITPE